VGIGGWVPEFPGELMDEKRVFSEQEAANLIVAAAKLQESDGEGPNYAAGVSWAQMQKMAQDVGVDPEYLRKALAGGSGQSTSNSKKQKRFLGMPMSEEFERVVDAEIPPENFDVIAPEFYNPGYGGGAGQGGFGGPSIIGRMMKGQFYEGMLYGTLEVSSRHGRTRIKAQTSNMVATWAIWMPFVLLTMFVGVAITSNRAPELWPLVWSFWGLGAAGSWAGLGALLTKYREKLPDKLDRMATAIVDEAEMLRKNVGSESVVDSVSTDEELRENLRSD
jgi:hypothetical protein